MNKYFLRTIIVACIIIPIITILYWIVEHDTKLCYENIDQIKVGDNSTEALAKMKSKMIFFRFDSEKYPGSLNLSDSIICVTFPYSYDNDDLSWQPNFCYSTKTKKIVSINYGRVN